MMIGMDLLGPGMWCLVWGQVQNVRQSAGYPPVTKLANTRFSKGYNWLCWSKWPPLWSSGHSSWLQIRRSGSIPGTTRKKSNGSGTGSTQPSEYNWGATWQKSSCSCLENREYGRRDPSSWPRVTLCPQKLATTSPTSGGRSVSIVRSRTQAIEFS
jgi:hypothetical protein